MIDTLRIVLSVIFCLIGFGGILGNWWIFIQLEILKRAPDTVDPNMPILNGVFGMLGLLLAPIDGIMYYAWIPLIIDPGCFEFVIYFRRIRENARGEDDEKKRISQ